MCFSRYIVILFLAVLSATSWADLNQGVTAYESADYTAAIVHFSPLAESGDPVAQYYLGRMYFLGDGVSQNYNEAAKWYSKSAKQGRPEAQVGMGTLYVTGKGVRQDIHEATNWFLMAAKQGYADGQFWVGYMYVSCPDHNICSGDTAIKYFTKAAEQGHGEAQNNLGAIYESSPDSADRFIMLAGIKQDYIEAYKWYEIAAKNGVSEASKNRDELSSKMSATQISKAKDLANEWIKQQKTPAPLTGDRDLSTPANSIIGHWVTDDNHHHYFGKPAQKGFRLGSYIHQKPKGKTFHYEYRIVSQNKTDKRVIVKVYFDDGSHEPMWLYILKDGKAMEKTIHIKRKKTEEVLEYVDDKVKP